MPLYDFKTQQAKSHRSKEPCGAPFLHGADERRQTEMLRTGNEKRQRCWKKICTWLMVGKRGRAARAWVTSYATLATRLRKQAKRAPAQADHFILEELLVT